MKDERAKHRTFTSMAQKRRWLALQDDIEGTRNAKKTKNDNDGNQAQQALSRASGQHPSDSR